MRASPTTVDSRSSAPAPSSPSRTASPFSARPMPAPTGWDTGTFSSTVTFAPARASSSAEAAPPVAPPTTTTFIPVSSMFVSPSSPGYARPRRGPMTAPADVVILAATSDSLRNDWGFSPVSDDGLGPGGGRGDGTGRGGAARRGGDRSRPAGRSGRPRPAASALQALAAAVATADRPPAGRAAGPVGDGRGRLRHATRHDGRAGAGLAAPVPRRPAP